MRNFLEIIAVPAITAPTTTRRGAALLGIQVTQADTDPSLAVLASLMVMANGSGSGTTVPTMLTASPSQILGAKDTRNALQVLTPGEWTVNVAPAAGAVASVTKAAVGAGRNVLRSLLVCVVGDGTAATVMNEFVVRDGATGVGTIIYRGTLRGAANTADIIAMAGLNIVGSVNTAMTLEFLAAPDAGHVQRISASGIDAFAV